MIDAMALIYRAHFAFINNPRTNSQGLNTSAMLGFTNSLVEILRKQKPSHIIVAFDMHQPTFRQKLYPPYKAHRQAQPEDITTSLPYIKNILHAFRIPIVQKPSYEADDLIGTLAHQASKQNYQIYMMTPDKDFGQLVSKNIFLYKPALSNRPTTIWGEPEVLQHWGISNITQITDIIGLWGDASDNIPGVPNIGQKTAQKLIAEFGTIENLLNNTDQLTQRMQTNLQKYSKQALMSKKLATICTKAPLTFDPTTSQYTGPIPKELLKIFQELEFHRLAQRILGTPTTPHTPIQTSLFPTNEKSQTTIQITPSMGTLATTPHSYHCLDTIAQCKELVKTLHEQPTFSFDTETTGLDPQTAHLLGISIAYKPYEAYYIPITPTNTQQVLDTLRPIFVHTQKLKIAQNLKYDLRVLQQHSIKVHPPFFDTMVAHHLLFPQARHSLNAMAADYFNYMPISIETLIGKKGPKQKNMAQVPLAKQVPYACEDADLTLQLYKKMEVELAEKNLAKLFYKVEMQVLPILANIEQTGVAIDTKALKTIANNLQKELDTLVQNIHKQAKETFNINSPKQLGKILFEKLQIEKTPTKTKTNQYATGIQTLNKLTNKHPIITKIINYREAKKLKTTYVDALPNNINPIDGRIHTTYHQINVTTGRLSSSNPNLQNIPIRTEKGRFIRKAFIAQHPDNYLLAADYSQIELRLMAHFSQDQNMITAFKEKKDIHTATATKIFQVAEKNVTTAMRRKAKMVNFGIIYGISPFGLAQRLEIPRKEAKKIINTYFEQFPRIKTYIEKTIEKARKQGFVTTLLGRKHTYANINSKNAHMRSRAERAAINMPIQGTAAELIKCAMIAINTWKQKENIPAKMIMQVHDELVFEAHTSTLPILKKNIPLLMQQALTLSVPIVVDIGIGKNWLTAH